MRKSFPRLSLLVVTGLTAALVTLSAMITGALPRARAQWRSAAVPPTVYSANVKPSTERPLVIAHRGASAKRPEHTLEAYRLAIEMGADYVEPDLVVTRDGVLIARHEHELSATTDVAKRPEFADRHRTKLVEGRPATGWFAEDFTLAEIRRLRAVAREPSTHDPYQVAAFDEIVALVQAESQRLGRSIGIYAELKNPAYFASIGLPVETRLAEGLRRAGWDRPDAPVFVESCEPSSLRRIRQLVPVPLIQLVPGRTGRPFDMVEAKNPHTWGDMLTPDGLRWIRTYADGVGIAKNLALDGRLVADAHRAGLRVHLWTFANQGRPADDVAQEYEKYYALDVDGVFSDDPDAAVAARAAFLNR